MEFEAALQNLQEECSCPICLDYFNDPVTTNCGHNFCHDCLIMCWKDLDDTFPCPACRFAFSRRNFRRNPQLRSLTETSKQLRIRRSKRKRQEEHCVCEKHNQFLTVFCMKDLELLCSQCSFSVEHQKHYICPIKDAAPYHRNIIEGSIQPLKNNVEQMEKVIILQGSKLLELRKKVEYRREEIYSEFEQVRLFLQNEQEAILKQVQDEESDMLTKLDENLKSLSDHLSTLKHLLKEVEDHCDMWPDLTLLTGITRISHKFHNLKCPEVFSFRLKKYGFSLPPQFSGLDTIIKQFQTDVVFDLGTAHPQLIVSNDGKAVVYTKVKRQARYSPTRLYLCPAVLGSRSFDSGRHYWEVDVGNKPKWTVGVCEDRLPRNWRNRPAVVDGFWAIGRYIESGYVVFGPKKSQLLPVVRPSKIGIFLDYDLGEVSFYNVDDRSLLYTFNDSFVRVVLPYFYVGIDPEPLKIVPMVNYEG